ncbi:MAG: transposase [Thiotrichales bacterium]
MARPTRIEIPGGLFFVSTRTERGAAGFLDDVDRHDWLEVLDQVCARFHWRVYAWCQLNDHYEVLLTTPEVNLSKGMRQLNGVYTQHFNRRHTRAGHVFQGRFKAVLVERESYLRGLAREVVLNPVRLGLATQSADWPWSSYLEMVGEEPCPHWLARDELLETFAKQPKRAIQKYTEFVDAGQGLPSLRANVRSQIFLGDDAFIGRMRATLEAKSKPAKKSARGQRKNHEHSLASFAARFPDRNEAIARAYLSGDFTLQAVGTHFGVHYTTVSRIVRAFENSLAAS